MRFLKRFFKKKMNKDDIEIMDSMLLDLSDELIDLEIRYDFSFPTHYTNRPAYSIDNCQLDITINIVNNITHRFQNNTPFEFAEYRFVQNRKNVQKLINSEVY